jgi:hypothetical protein
MAAGRRLGASYGKLDKSLDFPLSKSPVWWAILYDIQNQTLRTGVQPVRQMRFKSCSEFY